MPKHLAPHRLRAEREAQGDYEWEADFLLPLARGGRAAPDHEEFLSSKVEVRDTANGCGRGLFLSAPAAQGELLLVEQSCYECAPTSRLADLELSGWWAQLLPPQRRRLAALCAAAKSPEPLGTAVPLPIWGGSGADPPQPSSSWLAAASKLNAMACMELIEKPDGLRSIEASSAEDSLLGLFSIGAIMNHSCAPSMSWAPMPGWLAVRAPRDLPAGAELTDTYLDVRQPLDVRRAKLQDTWGFRCCCDRCRLEEMVWQDRGLRDRAAGLWRSFRGMVEGRRCEESELAKLVASSEEVTDQALESFLARAGGGERSSVASRLSEELLPALSLSQRQRGKLRGGGWRSPEGAGAAAGRAFLRMRALLLASLWLTPAFEYANGLQYTNRAERSTVIWKHIVAVIAEVCPGSVLHAAYALQYAVCAAEAGQTKADVQELLSNALSVIRIAYGGGTLTLRLLLGERVKEGRGANILSSALERICKEAETAAAQAEKAAAAVVATADGKAAATSSSSAASRVCDGAPPSSSSAGQASNRLELAGAPGGRSAEAEDIVTTVTAASGSEHELRIRLDADVGSSGRRLCAELCGVADCAALAVEASEGALRIGDRELPLPCRIDVETSQVRWSRRRQVVTLTATCLDDAAPR